MDDDKSRRYDRQLRIWGEHGQKALETADLCLVNATACGTETMKNLVLPGVRSVHIVDGERVTNEDVANNFFVTSVSVGRPRAEVAALLLRELNTNVDVQTTFADAGKVVAENINFFDRFSIVVITGLPDAALLRLTDHLHARGINAIVLKTNGYFGYLRNVLPSHYIFEARPRDVVADLRVLGTFPELQKFADGFPALNEIADSTVRAHVPFVVILIKTLAEFNRVVHGDGAAKGIQNYAQQKQFKQMLASLQRSDDELNFGEAFAAASRAYVPYAIPEDVRSCFNHPSCLHPTATTADFWLIVRAIRDFVQSDGQGMLPHSGQIPDMHSEPETYLKLQKVYLDKSLVDAHAVHSHLLIVMKECGCIAAGRTPPTIEEVHVFCKNSAFINYISTASLSQERVTLAAVRTNAAAAAVRTRLSNTMLTDFGEPLEAAEKVSVPNVGHYILFRAVEMFMHKHARMPGGLAAASDGGRGEETDAAKKKKRIEEDVDALVQMAQAVAVSEMGGGWEEVPLAAVAAEFVRYGGYELHAMASIMGGIAAQEALKILTRQNNPINHTFLFSSVTGKAVTLNI